MKNLTDFRSQNPQYNDMPDLALADALHLKFYSDIPKGEFFSKIGVSSAAIPGSEKSITLTPQPVSLQDRLMGAIETPAILAGQLGRMVATPVARMYGEAFGGSGTPQGQQKGEEVAQAVGRQFYQPRTETGPEIVQQISKVLSALPPTLGATGATLNAITPAAVSQAKSIVTPAATNTQQKLAALLQPKQPQMTGMGAASTDESLMRQQRALEQNIPLTKGEQLQSFPILQFESDVVKENPELAKSLLQFKEKQKSAILNRFEQLSQETGAEYADPTAYRKVGSLVDAQLVKQFENKKQKVNSAYTAARESGETKQVVDTGKLDQWLVENAPEGISVPQIQTIKAKLLFCAS
jgi:hypothetical protein